MRPSSTTIWFALFAGLALVCLLLAGERVAGIALHTLRLSLSSAAIAVPLGTLAAVLLVKTNAPLRGWMLAAFAVLLFVPLYLHAAAWQAALGVGGWLTVDPVEGLAKPWLDGWTGAIWIHAMAAVPWVVCIVAAALARVPAELEEAASLSVPAWRVVWSITLPTVLPAIAVATLWTMVSIAAEMTVTDFFQIRTFAEEVYTSAAAGGFQTNNPEADYAPWSPGPLNVALVAGVGLLTVLTTAALIPVVELLKVHDDVAERTWQWQLGGARWLAAAIPALVLGLVAVLPLASLVYKAGLGTSATADGWQRVWSFDKLQSELTAAIGLHARELEQTVSLGVGVATVAVVLGAAIGWHLRLSSRLPIFTLVGLAFAISVPGPLLGLFVIELLNHPTDSWLSFLTRAYDDTLLAPWLVQTARFTPAAALVMAAGYARVSSTLIDSARSDGAGWLRILLLVALPLNALMLAVAWLVVFALSTGELAATILVMPPGPPTLTVRLFALLHYGVEDRVAAISIVFLAALSGVAATTIWLARNCRLRGRRAV